MFAAAVCLGLGRRDVPNGFQQAMVVEPPDPRQRRQLDHLTQISPVTHFLVPANGIRSPLPVAFMTKMCSELVINPDGICASAVLAPRLEVQAPEVSVGPKFALGFFPRLFQSAMTSA